MPTLPAFWFGQVNTRPLSFLRIGIGLVLLRDALSHLPVASVFYSDRGVAPRAVVWEQLGSRSAWWAALAPGPDWAAVFLFLAWAVAAACLVVGYQTRWAALANFVCLNSTYWRNPFVTSGADDILRVVSFWLLFIPLDHHFSLGAKNRAPFEPTTLALPVRLLQIQVAWIYLMAGMFKLLGAPWRDGTAVYYVLQLTSLLRPTGEWLVANSPNLALRIITYLVLVGELAFTVLVFAPIGQPRLRLFGLLWMGVMHLGIAIVMVSPLVDFFLILGVTYTVFGAQTVAPAGSIGRKAVVQTLGAVVLMFTVLWQTADQFRAMLNPSAGPTLPGIQVSLLDATGLTQDWSLFAPAPYRVDWNIAFVGTFSDHATYNLRTGEPVRPEIDTLSPDEHFRWKRFEQYIALGGPPALLNAWSGYACRQYPGLRHVQIQLIYRYSHPPGQPLAPVLEDTMWLASCG